MASSSGLSDFLSSSLSSSSPCSSPPALLLQQALESPPRMSSSLSVLPSASASSSKLTTLIEPVQNQEQEQVKIEKPIFLNDQIIYLVNPTSAGENLVRNNNFCVANFDFKFQSWVPTPEQVLAKLEQHQQEKNPNIAFLLKSAIANLVENIWDTLSRIFPYDIPNKIIFGIAARFHQSYPALQLIYTQVSATYPETFTKSDIIVSIDCSNITFYI